MYPSTILAPAPDGTLLAQQHTEATNPAGWGRLVKPILFAIVAALLTTQIPGLLASVRDLHDLRFGPLVFALALSAVAILNRGWQSRAALDAVGLRSNLGDMTKVSGAAYALNKLVKTGGVGGIALHIRHGRTMLRPAPRVTAACLLEAMAGQLALLMMLIPSIVIMILSGSLTTQRVLLASAFAVTSLVLTGALLAGLSSQRMVRRVHAACYSLGRKVICRFGRRLLDRRQSSRPQPDRRQPDRLQPDQSQADRFSEAIASVRHQPRIAIPILTHALFGKALGALTLAAALAATRSNISIDKAVLVYVIALMAASVGILPGGLGLVEASMSTMLINYGVPAPLAIASVMAFRLLDFWLPMAFGLAAVGSLRISHRRHFDGSPDFDGGLDLAH